MALLSRLFGKQNAAQKAAHAEDLERSRAIAGRASAVSQADQDATRNRMEAEMSSQREQRNAASAKTDA